jgi:DNA-binding MarR family transcriptional regulator
LVEGGGLSVAGPGYDAYIHELENYIRKASVIIRKRGRDILADFEITPPQFNALLVLAETSGLTMGELCDHLYLACSTATDLIDRMERNGLITRERDTLDRRVIRLKMTPKGHQIIAEVMEARCRYLAGILERVDEPEKERLLESLKTLNSLMTRDRGDIQAV